METFNLTLVPLARDVPRVVKFTVLEAPAGVTERTLAVW